MNKEASKKIVEEIFLSFKKKQSEELTEEEKQKIFSEFVNKKVLRHDPKAIKIFLKFVEDLKTIKPNLTDNSVPYKDLPENMKKRAWEEFLKIIAKQFMDYESKKSNKYRIDLTKNMVPFEEIPENKKNLKNKVWEIFWNDLKKSSSLFNETELKLEKILKSLKMI